MKRTIRVTWGTICTIVAVLLFITVLAWWSTGIYAQDTARDDARPLPPARGEALTLTPTDMPDISCSVVEWKNDAATPTLALICPPQNVFAPLHVYLKLSWLKPEDVPLSAREITAASNTLTKLRTNKSTAWVWLGTRERQGVAPHRTWVAFNGLVDMALLTLSRRR